MSSFVVLRKSFDLSSDSNAHLLVGRQNRDIPIVTSGGAIITTMKQHYDFIVDVQFNSQEGSICQNQQFVLGSTYYKLPEPTKQQCIFEGWYTEPTGGIKIDTTSQVELSTTTLYAHWEYVDISNDCTEYVVQTTSSYKKTGIYAANRYSSTSAVYIDWGDGSVEKIDGNISQLTHTYTDVGTFNVKVSNNITSFAPSYNNSTWYGTTSQNRYTFNGMISTGSKVTSLPAYAFQYCQAMTNIDFMQTCWPTVTSLPNYCFYYCSGLTSIQGAKRFTSLGSQCFRYCTRLTGIQDLSEFKFTTLPNSYTFANCTNVTQWILPTRFTGTSFGNYMFSNCNNLVGVGSIEKTINQLKAVQIEYLETTGSQCIDTKLNIQSTDNLRIVFDFQFLTRKTNGNYQYIFSTTNEWLSFEVDINSPYHAYTNVGSTTLIAWSRTTIPYNQWIHCDYNINAQNKTINITGWKNISSSYSGSHGIGTFYICSRDNSNNVNHGVIAKFKPMQIYMNDILVRDLIPVRVGNIGYMYDKVSGQLFGNSGTGNFMLGQDKTDAEEIIVEQETITSKLPESLTSTGTYIFQNCSNLNNINIPSKVQSIGNYAFYGCTSLNNVKIESTNLTAINQYAFYNCNKLSNLSLPDTIKTIGDYAFYGDTSLDYAGRMANDLPYDAEIEYLENDGKQWIDTEIIPTESDEAEMLVYFKSDDSSGSKILFGTATPRLWVTTGTCRFNEENNCSINTKRILNEWNSIKINKDICVCNGTEIQMSDGTFQFTQNTVWLFGVNSSLAKTNARIKSFIWKRNNVEILNFIPVRIGNVGYMYDKVSGQLFGNSGTGNFILGPDVKTTSQHSELPSQLTSIGSYAYQGCSNLKSLNIQENLQTIEDYAFAGCYQISSIVDKRLTAQTVSTNTFGSATGTSTTAFTGYQTKGNNILCTYAAATGYDDGYWNDPLQEPTKCGFNIQYIDPENLHWCTIIFDAGSGSVSQSTKQVIYGKKIGELPKPICPADKPYFGGWYTEADGTGIKYSADSTAPSQDSLTLYAFYSAVALKSYTVDLNGQWRQSASQTNPDSVMYDGVYESNSNYNVNNGFAKMYIRISGYDEFTIYIRSYGESSYDYTLTFNPDVDVTSNPSTSTSGVKSHTSGNQQSGQAIGNYTKVTYTNLAGKDHFICIVYRKDGSVNDGNDRGYVLIPKEQ